MKKSHKSKAKVKVKKPMAVKKFPAPLPHAELLQKNPGKKITWEEERDLTKHNEILQQAKKTIEQRTEFFEDHKVKKDKKKGK